jgi:hypothetical protein
MPVTPAENPAATPFFITTPPAIVQTAPVASVRDAAGGMVEAPLEPPDDDELLLDDEDELDDEELADDPPLELELLLELIGVPLTW